MTLWLGAIIAIVLTIGLWLKARPNRHHRRMLRQADHSLDRIRDISTTRPGAALLYIRKMHPHAVEELVLTAAESAGHKIKRNERYTGDGGLDGQVMINGTWHLIQTKRYGTSINPVHVRDFVELCQRRRQPGLFIHTGRTGDKSHQHADNHIIRFVSGDSLLNLINGHPLRPVAGARHHYAGRSPSPRAA